jgi:hypothetical protein
VEAKSSGNNEVDRFDTLSVGDKFNEAFDMGTVLLPLSLIEVEDQFCSSDKRFRLVSDIICNLLLFLPQLVKWFS